MTYLRIQRFEDENTRHAAMESWNHVYPSLIVDFYSSDCVFYVGSKICSIETSSSYKPDNRY
jgi:hypothetical protein